MSEEEKVANQRGPAMGELGWAGNAVVLLSPKHNVVDNDWVARVSIVDGLVSCDSPEHLDDWNRNGILGRSDRGVLYPRDGQAFLDELPFAYRSPYLWAEIVG